MGIIDEYLKKFGLTRYRVVVMTGISQNTLANANRKDASHLSVKTIQALAEASGETPGKVLDSILESEDEH